MAAALLFIISELKRQRSRLSPLRLLRRQGSSRFQHNFGLHPPDIQHAVLDHELISQFKEIFVIGDVHGCYDELIELLNSAQVNKSNVLKIFVGDLINKGPQNERVLNLVRRMESTMSVRGNHDEVVLKIYNDSLDPLKVILPHNKWMTELSKENINYLNSLPYTIRLPLLNCIIVHAGLVPGIPLERMLPVDLVTMRNVIIEDYFNGAGVKPVQSHKEGFPWAESWPGPFHVFFGHDAKRMLQLCPYATGLDTGCVYGKKLTGTFIYGPRKGTFVQVDAKEVYSKPKG